MNWILKAVEQTWKSGMKFELGKSFAFPHCIAAFLLNTKIIQFLLTSNKITHFVNSNSHFSCIIWSNIIIIIYFYNNVLESKQLIKSKLILFKNNNFGL